MVRPNRILSSGEIFANIEEDLRDNNAGEISAQDIRDNMLDIVESMTLVVSSGNFDSRFPFMKNVRSKIDTNTSNRTGLFYAESGIVFGPNGGRGEQFEAYPGVEGIDHNSLANLTEGNPHTQYLDVEGTNVAEQNIAFGEVWLNSSGTSSELDTDDRGISFEYTDVDVSGEVIKIGSDSTLRFDVDNSRAVSAKGLAQAWISFNAAADGIDEMEVISSYNIYKLQRTSGPGKFTIFFTNGTFLDANYVAIGSSNSRSNNTSAEDFEMNTVGIVDRGEEYLSFCVLNEAGEYVDAAVNDLIVFGNASGVIPSTGVIIEDLTP